jgi:hypothetical protein
MSTRPVSATLPLEQERDGLLARLHARSDDVAATKALQAVSRTLASLPADDADDDQPDGLRRHGLSFFDRLRARSHRRR